MTITSRPQSYGERLLRVGKAFALAGEPSIIQTLEPQRLGIRPIYPDVLSLFFSAYKALKSGLDEGDFALAKAAVRVMDHALIKPVEEAANVCFYSETAPLEGNTRIWASQGEAHVITADKVNPLAVALRYQRENKPFGKFEGRVAKDLIIVMGLERH